MALAALAVTAALAAIFRPTPVHAQGVLDMRCTNDSLDPATARLRLEWARQCGTTLNIVFPGAPKQPASSYDTGIVAADNVTHLIEYIETDDSQGTNSFSGVSAEINGTFTHYQWHTGLTTTSTDANGFQKWTQPAALLLPRPNYPTFGDAYNINTAKQLYPNPNYSLHDCHLYKDQAATVLADTSSTGFFVNGFCTSSCYTPEQEISFATGNEKILDALNEFRTGVTTLTPDSTLHDIRFQADGVASYTRELHDATIVIFEIHTASGGELRVTATHPVLEGNGRIVTAQSLKVGQKLIKPDGSRDQIVSINTTSIFGKVYNLKPNSTARVSNILIAQGFLVGSSRYQNDDVTYINRIILGRGIPKDIIPQ